MTDQAPVREELLRKILSWYALPSTWASVHAPSPYSSSAGSGAGRDRGRLAASAAAERSAGGLLRILCDAHGIALTALGRRAGVADARMGQIATGSPIEPAEWELLRLRIGEMTEGPC